MMSRFLLAVALAAGVLGTAAAQSTQPAPENVPPGGFVPDDDEMAAIQKARERCQNAGGPQEQQSCMNQAQMDYYRARSDKGGAPVDPGAPGGSAPGAGPHGGGSMQPPDPAAGGGSTSPGSSSGSRMPTQ